MIKIFKNKKVLLLILIVIILFFFLTKDRQKELSYKVSGNELLEIKEKCKNLAHAKLDEFNSYNLGFHTLDGYGYSEFRGICYAEFIRKHSNDFSSIVLYNTTEEKEMVTRKWPQDLNWYDSDFDHIILGRSRILDFRAPW